ncbi:mechanosensitive ion channel family protein [Novipirellula herctigrandis]|uniref:mechanosensitive ion channel family protein n=1 Tax=Novipirellula herctigrandis TaxID=2527986 RepID=UPI003AF35A17
MFGSWVAVACIFSVTYGQEAKQVGPADTSSPRATLKSFIDSVNQFHQRTMEERFFDRRIGRHMAPVNRALDCLNTNELPEYAREQMAGDAAIRLKEILDRAPLPPYEEIPDLDAIEANGGQLARWHLPGTRISIARVEEGPRKYEYLFTPGTIGRVAQYYEEVEELPYRTTGPNVSPGFFDWYFSAPGHPSVARIVDRLPDWMRDNFAGISVWKWVGLVMSMLLSITLMIGIYRVQRTLSNRWRDDAPMKYCLMILLPILAMLVPFAFSSFTQNHLTLRGTPLVIVSFASRVVTLLAGIVVIFAVTDRVAEIVVRSEQENRRRLNRQLIRIIAKITAIVASVIVVLEGGQRLGIPLTTLLASAGVGGLTVALAAQHGLKSVFATLMLMTDKPFRVGDRILVQGFDGVVENIGLRSTRIRLLLGHAVTIPNDELAGHNIENVGNRTSIRRVTDLQLPLNTPREKLEKVVALIRDLLRDNENLDPELPPRVFFNEFNEGAFNIRIMYWYVPPDYWKFMEFTEQLNLEICRVFEEHGIRFTLPDRVAHTGIDGDEQPVDVRVLGK